MYCTRCGSPNNDNAWQCVQCGTVMPRNTPAPPSIPTAPIAVDNFLVPAILTTLCCCLPFGIVAIVHAAQVNTKLRVGDFPGAQASSRSAKTWTLVALLSGLAVGAVYTTVMMIDQM